MLDIGLLQIVDTFFFQSQTSKQNNVLKRGREEQGW